MAFQISHAQHSLPDASGQASSCTQSILQQPPPRYTPRPAQRRVETLERRRRPLQSQALAPCASWSFTGSLVSLTRPHHHHTSSAKHDVIDAEGDPPPPPPCSPTRPRRCTGRPTSPATTWRRCCSRRRAGCAPPASCWPCSGGCCPRCRE